MTTAQLDQIEDRALRQEGTRDLRDFLNAHGWSMTLLELSQERARRNVAPGKNGPSNPTHRESH